MTDKATVKAGVSREAAKIHDGLNGWIDHNVPPAQGAALGIALLRIVAHELRACYDKAKILDMLARIINEEKPRYTPNEIRAILDEGSR